MSLNALVHSYNCNYRTAVLIVELAITSSLRLAGPSTLKDVELVLPQVQRNLSFPQKNLRRSSLHSIAFTPVVRRERYNAHPNKR